MEWLGFLVQVEQLNYKTNTVVIVITTRNREYPLGLLLWLSGYASDEVVT